MGLLEVWAPLGCAMVPTCLRVNGTRMENEGRRRPQYLWRVVRLCLTAPQQRSVLSPEPKVGCLPPSGLHTCANLTGPTKDERQWAMEAAPADGTATGISRNVKLSAQRLFA